MAGDVNFLVHRERVHATDNPITIRPTGLSGITPKAVYAFCSADFDTDGTIGADAGFSEGFTNGTTTCSKGVFEEDAQATSQIRTWQADGDLCQILNVAGTELLALDSPSLVSGGLNLTPSTRTNRPTVTYVFFYGADLQVAAGKITGFDAGGGDAGGDTVAVTTGLSGSNLDNQLILFLTGQIGPTWTSASQSSSSTTSRAIGAAYRDGVAGAPDAQWATTYATRQGAGVGRCENTVRTDRVACAIVSGSLNKTYSCADISDATFTVQAFGTAQNTPMAYLVLETDTKKTWCGVEDSSTTGTWTVTSPGWEPGFVQANFTQATALSTIKTSDLDVYGAGVATADDQSCQTACTEDAAADMVCKSLASDKFVDALEDDGTSGWEQAATGDFGFTSTGWTVTNITVGTAGSSARKWPCFAIEGAVSTPTGTGTITLGVSTLSAQAVMEPDGSGVLALDETLLSAAGLQEIPGTSSLSLSDTALNAIGNLGISGTAAVSLSEILIDAQGAQEYIATAAPILSTMVLDADGNAAVAPDGTGTLVLDNTTLAGTGVQSIPGAGTVLLETIVLNADGFFGAPEGTGTLILDQAALDSQAVMLPDGSAVIVLDLTVLAAQGLGPAPEGSPWIIYARRRGRR